MATWWLLVVKVREDVGGVNLTLDYLTSHSYSTGTNHELCLIRERATSMKCLVWHLSGGDSGQLILVVKNMSWKVAHTFAYAPHRASYERQPPRGLKGVNEQLSGSIVGRTCVFLVVVVSEAQVRVNRVPT